jgi:sorbitol-specific phosphotransferase system component IIA
MFGEHRLQSHLELRTVYFRDNFVPHKKLRDISVIRCNIKRQSDLQAAGRRFPVYSHQWRDKCFPDAAGT